MIFANNIENLKNYKEAENNLKLAHQMTPNRFFPIYRLALLYQKIGEEQKANHLAKEIIIKPVKIESPEIIAIKCEMKTILENSKVNY
ncbi:MAG: hypothetical protein Q8908_06215 [Bacteroidota bacterium]|nr:hypothetical protein [Bacteroidota bacterium]